jgi:localization factor PodJL
VKSLFVAASIIAIVIGSFQIMGNVFDQGAPHGDAAKTGAADPARTDTVSDRAAPSRQERNLAAAPPVRPEAAPTTPPGLGLAVQNAPSLLNPPALGPAFNAPAAPSSGDITGSIPMPPAKEPARGRTHHAFDDRLPLSIGSDRLRSAALDGDAPAAYEVAVRYADGRGVPANPQEAAHWFERAASKGLVPAQFRYASMLEKGHGIKKDMAGARRLYLAAAGRGHAKAMHNLAVLYAEGIDGRPDYATAVKWFRKAAQRGIADSQYNLGILTARGLGSEKNLAESYTWFALAAAQGDRESNRKRDEVASHLEAEELAAAQKAVKTFTPVAQPDAALHVPKPPGGWDNTTAKEAPAKAAPPPRVKRERDAPNAPLSLGSFTVGKR